jgi:hypothetical protein
VTNGTQKSKNWMLKLFARASATRSGGLWHREKASQEGTEEEQWRRLDRWVKCGRTSVAKSSCDGVVRLIREEGMSQAEEVPVVTCELRL